ncbi:MAG: 2OG-Fe(II) oxygenase [Solirubrobacterales bacterium]|nr:2OG-Fe(II) oxygenase [Solirubrobacterales bacterium]
MTAVTIPPAIADRLAALPWAQLHEALDAHGFAETPAVLSAAECEQLVGLYEAGRFRSTITMARHRFGQGEYKYFDHPLPGPVADLRTGFYPPLAEAANRWADRLGEDIRYPVDHAAFLQRCHAAGQSRPTPLILRYGPGDWNALHQDLYGDLAFPFQVVTVLERPGADFRGGEFVLLEQRPRAQSRAHVVNLRQGAFLIFATRQRPARGSRGFYRAAIRHGVSTVTAGRRTTLGIVFHDAR